MKKKYIKPDASVVTLHLLGSILQEGGTINRASNTTGTFTARELKNDVWDEEEEENTGGWFQ